jgi:hypothetical protein
MRRGCTVLLFVSLLAGCGGGDSGPRTGKAGGDQRAEVVEAAKSYQSAVLDKNAKTFCDLLAGKAKEEVLSVAAGLGGPASCEESAKRVFDLAGRDDLARVRRSRDQLRPESVTIRGDRATVRLGNGRRLKMLRSEGGWLVASANVRR